MLLRGFVFSILAALALHGQGTRAEDCAASGTVVNAITGAPISKALVTFGVTLTGIPSMGAATDAAGKWRIVTTTCGAGGLRATRAGFIEGQYRPDATSPRALLHLVSGTPLRDLKIALMPEAAVTGRVQDPDGDPIAGAQVKSLNVAVMNGKRMFVQGHGVVADGQGNFRIGGLAPGRYIFCASSDQVTYPVGGGGVQIYRGECYPGQESSVSSAMPVEAGREIRTTLTLRPVSGAHIRGKVSQAGALVQLLLPPTAIITSYRAQADQDGHFDIGGVPRGSWIIEARSSGAVMSALAPVEVGDTDVENLTLTLQPPGSLSGIVRFDLSHRAKTRAGDANPTVNISLNSTDGTGGFGPIQWDASHLTFVDSKVQAGEYRLNTYANAPGTYIKSAMLSGQNVANRPFRVEGSTGPIEIVVSDDTGDIDATLTDADDHPAAGTLILMPRTGMPIVIFGGDDGKCSKNYIPSGEYRAWAFDDISNVPYEEDEWMTQHAGAAQRVTITSAGTTSIRLKIAVASAE